MWLSHIDFGGNTGPVSKVIIAVSLILIYCKKIKCMTDKSYNEMNHNLSIDLLLPKAQNAKNRTLIFPILVSKLW